MFQNIQFKSTTSDRLQNGKLKGYQQLNAAKY